jgi:hypothetical protein
VVTARALLALCSKVALIVVEMLVSESLGLVGSARIHVLATHVYCITDTVRLRMQQTGVCTILKALNYFRVAVSAF